MQFYFDYYFKTLSKYGKLHCHPLILSRPTKIKLSEINLEEAPIDPAFAASCLNVSLHLLSTLADLWRELPCVWQLFQFLNEQLLNSLPTGDLHEEVLKNLDVLKEKLSVLKGESRERKGPGLVPKKPVTMLKLYEPEIEDE